MLSPDEIEVLNTWKTIAELWEHRSKHLLQSVERAFQRGTMKGFEDMPAFAFNSQGINANYGGGSGGLPVGKHPVTITGSALKPTANNQGGMMVFTLTAFDGPAKGVSHDDRLNLHNPSAEAVRIANEQLAAYCAVVGVPAFQATEELHGKPFVVEIAQQKNNPNYTEVVALFDMNGNKPGQSGSGPQTQQQSNGGQGFGQQSGGGQQAGGFGANGSIPPQGQGGQQAGGNGGAWGQQSGGQQPQGDQGGQQGGQGQQGNGGGAWGQQGQQGQNGQNGQNGGGAGQGWQQGGGAGGGTPGWGQR